MEEKNSTEQPQQKVLRIRGRRGEMVFWIIVPLILLFVNREFKDIERMKVLAKILCSFIIITILGLVVILFHAIVVEIQMDRIHMRRVLFGFVKVERTLDFRNVRKVIIVKLPIGTLGVLTGKTNRIYEIRFLPRTSAPNVPLTLSILHFSNKQLEQIEEIVNVLGASTRITTEVKWRKEQ